MATLTLKINGNQVELNTHETPNGVMYKAQDLLSPLRLSSKERANSLSNWKISVESELLENQVLSKRGKNGGTYLSREDLFKFASYIDKAFGESVITAFSLLTEGRREEAQLVASSVVFDLEYANKVEVRWKEFCKFMYTNFSDVNRHYGGNITRLAVKSATGAPRVQNISGEKSDSTLVERLIHQRHGDAIAAIDITLTMLERFIKMPSMRRLMQTREGQKEVYENMKALFIE